MPPGGEAAFFAAAATILLSIEKSMLFREKWKHHLSMYASLSAIKIEYDIAKVSDNEVLTRIENILDKYSSDLPIESRK